MVDKLRKRLEEINELIYANNLYVGSEEYFKVRELCTMHLKEQEIVEETFVRDDISHALAYGYSARRSGITHHEALIEYKRSNNLE